MTPIRRDVACTVCGVAACICANAGAFVEALHQREVPPRPAILREELPPEPPHTHEDSDRSVRIAANDVAVGGDLGELPPSPASWQPYDAASTLLRSYDRAHRLRHPAYFGSANFMPPSPPELDHTYEEFERAARGEGQAAGIASGGSFTITPGSGSYRIEGQQAQLE